MATFRYSIALLAAAAVSTAFAQDMTTAYDPETGKEYSTTDHEAVNEYNIFKNTEIIYYGESAQPADKAASAALIRQFYEDQFRHAQDPNSPYFLMMSRNGKLAMGIGGDVELLGSYDFDGSMKGSGFIPYDIPIPKDKSSENLLQLMPNRSDIFFTILGKNTKVGDFRVFVQAKFNGPNNTLKLNKAYATVADWTFGLAHSTFEDPKSQPSTLESQGPNSEVSDTRMLVRYMHSLGKQFTVAASIEDPHVDIPTSANYRACTSNIPNVAAFLQYEYAKQHIRLSAVIKNMGYTDLVKMDNHNVVGWGVNLGMKLRPVDPLTVYAAVNAGQGIGSLVNDLAEGNNDLIGYTDEPGKMYAPKSFGWYGALQYNYRPNIFSTVIISQERLLTKSDSDYSPASYRYGLYGTANLFWNPVPRLQLGAEFNIGKRCNEDHENRLGYRASLMAKYSF